MHQSIKQIAQTRLSCCFGALREVSCECEEGVLVLRGRVPSYYHKQLAQEAVAHLDGVVRVVNEVEVVS